MRFITNIFNAVYNNLISGGAYYQIAKGVLVTAAVTVIAWIVAAGCGCLFSYLMCFEKKIVSSIGRGLCFVFRSVPVILCAEEDVVGNHGASIGRLDEGISYYLQTRGMTPEEVERMMARARLEAVIRKIPEEAVRNRLLETEEKDA